MSETENYLNVPTEELQKRFRELNLDRTPKENFEKAEQARELRSLKAELGRRAIEFNHAKKFSSELNRRDDESILDELELVKREFKFKGELD